MTIGKSSAALAVARGLAALAWADEVDPTFAKLAARTNERVGGTSLSRLTRDSYTAFLKTEP